MAPFDAVDPDPLDSPRGWTLVALATLAPLSIDAPAGAGGGYGLPLAALGPFTPFGARQFYRRTDPDVGR